MYKYIDDCPLSIPRQDDNETEDGCGNLIPAQNSKIQLPRRHRMENGGCDRYGVGFISHCLRFQLLFVFTV